MISPTSSSALNLSRRGAQLLSVGTALPPRAYSQEQVLEWSAETDPKIHRLFRNSHIDSRCLYLPDRINGHPPEESNRELLDKHLRGVLDIGPKAIEGALAPLGLDVADIEFLVCVTSTGFLCPGISAHLIKHMGMRDSMRRLDVVGMGCNAAVNGLQAATAMAQARPGKIGVIVCIEVCSAAYVINRKMSTAVVNSLFGDGAAAMVVRAGANGEMLPHAPAVVDFEPFILTDAIDAMKYEVEDSKLSFFLAKDIPAVIGQHVSIPVNRLLERHGLELPDIKHWLIHSGGKKVIDAIQANLGLTEHDVRHTRSVLRANGNMSSGSVLFTFDELQREGVTNSGDIGVLIAMGPGTAIETALLAW
jgi:polyketide synthase Type III